MAGWPASLHSFVAGEVHRAAHHTEIRDALLALMPSVALVATAETRNVNTFADLATPGPALTVVTQDKALVIVTCQIQPGTVNEGGLMGFAVSGATTVAASDAQALALISPTTSRWLSASAMFRVSGLTPGSNTFTAKYRTTVGTTTFSNRGIIVIGV